LILTDTPVSKKISKKEIRKKVDVKGEIYLK
jgi:hypothetical protein